MISFKGFLIKEMNQLCLERFNKVKNKSKLNLVYSFFHAYRHLFS